MPSLCLNRYTPLLLAVVCVIHTEAYPSYQPDVPYGVAFNKGGGRSTALGHLGRIIPGTPHNQFGLDYLNAGGVWLNGLCQADSDNDNFTNGVELGDPNCTWVKGQVPPAPLTSDPTNAISTPLNPIFPEAVEIYVYAHGVLMLLAWVGLVPFGIMQATLYKKSEDSEYDWLRAHKIANVSGAVITLIAFIVMFALGPGLSGITATNHGILGIIVVAAGFVQIVTGILRPHNPPAGELKGTTRLFWEMIHQWGGRLTFFVALGAIFTGMPLGFGTDLGTIVGVGVVLLGICGALGSIYYVAFERDGRINAPFEQNVKRKGDMVKA